MQQQQQVEGAQPAVAEIPSVPAGPEVGVAPAQANSMPVIEEDEAESEEDQNEGEESEDEDKEEEEEKHHRHHHHRHHKKQHHKAPASVAVLFDPKLYSRESDSDNEDDKGKLTTINSELYNKQLTSAVLAAKKSANAPKNCGQEKEAPGADTAELPNNLHQVDEDTGLNDIHVMGDYHAMLNLTDVDYGKLGHNKYYLIQLLESNDKQTYYVFSKWGRVGATKHTLPSSPKFYHRSDAVAEFEKKFREKTGRSWNDRATLDPIEGKYTYIQAEGAPSALTRLADKEEELKKAMEEAWKRPSRLQPEVADIMGVVWDLKRMQRTMHELNFNPEKFPLGKLSKAQIQRGFAILGKIQEVLLSGKRNEDKLLRLTNKFYTEIPQNYGMKKPPMINYVQRLREKIQLLEALADIEVAHSYLINSLTDLQAKSAADVFYDLLNCGIQPLSLGSPEAGTIIDAIRNTHGPTHTSYKLSVESVFSLQKQQDDMRFYAFRQLPNRRLLWHGSRTTNLAGILMNGLKIAPTEAPSTGYMFGKGIYFSEVSSKAANYCKPTKSQPDILLLLCEVALGNVHKLFATKSFKRPPSTFHSVMGVGKYCPDPKMARDWDGARMDLGSAVENEELPHGPGVKTSSELQYNEFVIYDVAQVRLAYLVKCRAVFTGDDEAVAADTVA